MKGNFLESVLLTQYANTNLEGLTQKGHIRMHVFYFHHVAKMKT